MTLDDLQEALRLEQTRANERDEARAEVERLRRIADEVRRLVNSGYAGPFEGAAIEPLVAAVREYERSCRDQS